MSILFALRHPAAAQGLPLWRATGGGLAARQGGMAAICETEQELKSIKTPACVVPGYRD